MRNQYNDKRNRGGQRRGVGSERSPDRGSSDLYPGGVDNGLDRRMNRDSESRLPGISYDSDYGFGRRDDSALSSNDDRLERNERNFENSNYGSQEFSYGSGASLPNYGYETGSRGWEEYPSPRSNSRRDRNAHHEQSFFERMGEKVGEFFGKGPKGYRRSDDRIREDVSEALYRHRHIDATEVEVSVSEGEVTLSGTVHERSMKRLIEDEADKVAGVRDVHNGIRCVQRAGPASQIVPRSGLENSSSGSGPATPSSTKNPGKRIQ